MANREILKVKFKNRILVMLTTVPKRSRIMKRYRKVLIVMQLLREMLHVRTQFLNIFTL